MPNGVFGSVVPASRIRCNSTVSDGVVPQAPGCIIRVGDHVALDGVDEPKTLFVAALGG